jgi:predicted DCC family thiol-disulfide oxidoreductase YuxK
VTLWGGEYTGLHVIAAAARPNRRGPTRREEWRVADWQFQVLCDGQCPYCRLEARWLRALDRRRGRLALTDIAADGFDPARYGRTLPDLMGSLHGVFPDGRQTTGVETFRQAYRAVGLGWLLAPTRWPVLRPLADALYRLFARNRVRLGRLAGRGCAAGRCAIPVADGRGGRG